MLYFQEMLSGTDSLPHDNSRGNMDRVGVLDGKSPRIKVLLNSLQHLLLNSCSSNFKNHKHKCTFVFSSCY